jgi:site-specific DNA-methyltransferase (adenine-specific)
MLLPPPRADGAPRRILVPFSGSGSEMIGCLLAGWDEVIGVEMSAEYAEIARARRGHWERYRRADSEAAEAESAGQQALF